MAEEFQESEVAFEDINVHGHDSDGACSNFQSSSRAIRGEKAKRKKLKKTTSSSVPVSIPENVSWLRYVDGDLDGDDCEMVPPHVIVGRRVAGRMMSFSVCTGNGRTLKGTDLSEVRNSILRLTGFLET